MADITLENSYKMFQTQRVLLAVLSGLLLPTTGHAQKAQQDSTMRNTELTQVVVTGTGTHNKAQNAVVPVQVITSEELQRMHVTNLEDALTRLTSSVTFMTNGMGTTMMMNGLNEDYILILENGKRLTGDDRYTRINMANVKRIEVLSGASIRKPSSMSPTTHPIPARAGSRKLSP